MARWCNLQGEQLKTAAGVEAASLLNGVTGARLAAFTNADLEEHGLPPRMRAYITDKLLQKPAAPSVEEQLEQTEREKGVLRSHLTRQSSEHALSGEEEPLLSEGPGRASVRALAATAALAAIAGGVTGFLAGEKEKRDRGETGLDGTLPSNVGALPYQWAAQSADLGLDFVKKALEIAEKAPLVGAVFTLCLIVAQSAEQALCNKNSCAELGRLACRIATILASAEEDTLARVDTSVAALKEALREAAELVATFSKRGWLRRLASANGDAEKFKRLHEHLRQEMATLSFDLQVSTPVFRDESKALRALVLSKTGRSVEQGGLASLLEQPEGREALRGTLGADAQALSAEMEALSGQLEGVRHVVDATLHLARTKELRGAVQLSVQMTQKSKRGAGAGATYLQMAPLHNAPPPGRDVAAFRVMTGHAVEVALQVSECDSNSELRIKAIERLEHVECSYYAATAASRRAACCGDVLGLGWAGVGERRTAVLFEADDVVIDADEPRVARLALALPADAGPSGQLCTLRLRMWVSFRPAPTLGLGFEEGATVPVTQTLHLAVYGKKGRASFALKDLEDNVAREKAGLMGLGPILALPMLIHRKHLRGTEEALQQQLVGFGRLGKAREE